MAAMVLIFTACQQSGTGTEPQNQTVTFKMATPAPEAFDAWDFVWKGPKRSPAANLQAEVIQPDGGLYAKQDFIAYPGKSDPIHTSFSPGFAGGDPKVFFHQTIRIRFRVEKGALVFVPADIKTFHFRFFKKDSTGDIDWRLPFENIEAVLDSSSS